MPFRFVGTGAALLVALVLLSGCAVSAKTHALGHMQAAAAAMEAYDYSLVQRELEAARSLSGPTAETESLQAAIYTRTGFTDQAEASYRRAAELDPGYPMAHSNLAALLIARGRAREAAGVLEAALPVAPDSAFLLNNLGVARMALGDLAGAESALTEAVKADPRDAYAATNHAFVLWEKGAVRRAMEEWKTAAFINPAMGDQRAGLAIGLWEEGRHAQAVKELAAAYHLDATFRWPELVARKYHWPPRALGVLAQIAPHIQLKGPGYHIGLEDAIMPFGAAEYQEAPIVADIIRDSQSSDGAERGTDSGP